MVKDFASFDPFDASAAGTHHERMAELRAQCPVARLSSGMVVVSRYEDVKTMLGDRRMSNRNAARAPGVDVPADDRFFFFEYDPPRHPALRQVLRDLLSRQRAQRDAPQTRALADELLAPMIAAGGGEMVQGFTARFAGRLMMRIAGFPEADAPRWRAWIRDMIISGFSFTNTNERGVGFEQCYPDMLEYLDAHIDTRSAASEKPDDVLTRVTMAEADGEPLNRTLQRMILFSIPSAGGNTMGNFINNTLLSLARDPGLVESLRADRSLVPRAVEESLRKDTPSMFLSRICADEMEVEGVAVGSGDKVMLGLASANRDESVYHDSEEFRLDRDGQPAHVGFGWGTHTCIGAPVVRQTGEVVLNALLDQVATIAVETGSAPVPYMSPQGNGLDELHVRLTAVARAAAVPNLDER